jgi:hypothetical protein
MSMLVQGVWGTPLPSDIQSTLLISRTVRWEDVPKIDDRPVAFVAAGSHGVWSTPGHHVYADVSQPLVPWCVHGAHK